MSGSPSSSSSSSSAPSSSAKPAAVAGAAATATNESSSTVAASSAGGGWRSLRPRPTKWFMEAVQRRPFRSAFLLGAAVSFTLSSYQQQMQEQLEEAEDAKTKKVLVLPFYKMKIVEETSSNPLRALAGGGSSSSNAEKTVEMSIDQVVDLIHRASADPQIVALYGILGHGSGFSTGGWAHTEELRNALLVFQQSHRRHKEPDRSHYLLSSLLQNNKEESREETSTTGGAAASAAAKEQPPSPRPVEPKPMYLYTNTFSTPTPNGGADMKEYYVASAFTHLHLQPQGDLNLFGLHATHTFYRDFLAKYGITVHVWKHGKYKNFANQFTHSSYDPAHIENVSKVLVGIHQHVCSGMYKARYQQLKDYEYSTFWKMVHRAGSLPASMAQRIGFVDYLPPLNPLEDLLSYQRIRSKASDDTPPTSSSDSTTTPTTAAATTSTSTTDGEKSNASKGVLSEKSKDESDDKKEALEAKWMNPSLSLDSAAASSGPLTDLQQFSATKSISIMEYARRTKEKDRKKEKEWQVYEQIQKLPAGMRSMLGMMGLTAPFYNFDKSEFDEAEAKGRKEQIAVLKIGGPITDATARKLEKPLRQLKKAKDKVKAVVVRVDSPGGAITACETIHQQLQDLPQKVVVSFGNVSASGGYYISANSERIFASPTTITGSIGVVMLRADLRGLASQWGVTFDSVPTSELSGSFDPFYPMNGRMKDNFANFADRAYLHFKRLVSKGRGMDMGQVEEVAQGRVWTGEQAKEHGLVDELGGLDRAIAHCQRNFTDSGKAKVVVWPPKKSLFQAWMDSRRRRYGDDNEEEDSLDDIEVPSMMEVALAGLEDGPFDLRRLLLGDGESSSISVADQEGSKKSTISSLENLAREGRLPMAMSGLMLTVDENAAIRCLLQENEVPDVLANLPPGFWEN